MKTPWCHRFRLEPGKQGGPEPLEVCFGRGEGELGLKAKQSGRRGFNGLRMWNVNRGPSSRFGLWGHLLYFPPLHRRPNPLHSGRSSRHEMFIYRYNRTTVLDSPFIILFRTRQILKCAVSWDKKPNVRYMTLFAYFQQCQHAYNYQHPHGSSFS